MKKLSIYLLALLTMGLAACTEDYAPSVGPQSNLPESQLQVSDVSVTPLLTNFNIADYINDETGDETPIEIASVNVKEGALPANTILKADVEISNDPNFEKSIILPANSLAESNIISIQPNNLEDEFFSKITKNPAQTKVYVRTILYTVTDGTSVAIVGKPNENYFAQQNVDMTPLMKVKISTNYYIVGGPNSDWAASAANKSIKFEHSGEDVYVDPIFTVVFDAAASGDTWFAIGDDEACAAIGNNDWSKLLGIVGDDSEVKEGTMDFRYNLGGDHSFKVAEGAKKIRVTLNMLEYSFKVEVVNIAEAYYLIGGEKGWSEAEALTQPFTHSDKSVFEDPIFTYVINGGAERWFSFGDADALAAINSNDWKQLYGYVGQQEDKGTFARRCDIEGAPDNTFHVDGSAKFYRFTVNMMTMEYEITALNFDPFIYFIGATDGWSKAEQRLALTDDSGIYTGFLYCADPNSWGNEFKFQKEAGNWGTEINTGMMTGGIGGDFTEGGGGNFKANAGEGVYYVTLDMAKMTINAVRITNMNLVGSFNGWNQADNAQQMTWNATDYCFEITGAGVNADGWKFTANNAWSINLGGDVADLTADGSNLSVVGTTIKLYPTRKTSDNIYCTVE